MVPPRTELRLYPVYLTSEPEVPMLVIIFLIRKSRAGGCVAAPTWGQAGCLLFDTNLLLPRNTSWCEVTPWEVCSLLIQISLHFVSTQLPIRPAAPWSCNAVCFQVTQILWPWSEQTPSLLKMLRNPSALPKSLSCSNQRTLGCFKCPAVLQPSL